MGFFASLVNALVAFFQTLQPTPEKTPATPEPKPTSSVPVTSSASPTTSSQIVNASGAIVAVYTGNADATVATIAESFDVNRKQRIMVNLRMDNADVVYMFKAYDRRPNSDEYVLCEHQSIITSSKDGGLTLGKSAAYYISYPGTNGWTVGKHSLKIVLADAQNNTVLSCRVVELNVASPVGGE